MQALFFFYSVTFALIGFAASPDSIHASLNSTELAHTPFRVVLDPGHGGSDHGTVFKDGNQSGSTSISEKDITLALALETALFLKTRGYEVVLTRTQDRDVSLPERTKIANQLKADVFLSIHINSNPNQLSHLGGIETYFLNNTSDESSRRLSALENTSNRPNLPDLTHSGGEALNEDSTDVALIVKDLVLDANLAESKRLACSLQSHLAGRDYSSSAWPQHPYDRGVKQALFHVLLGADMPAVLVEAGFFSNPQDRARITSPEGRKATAAAIARAIDLFKSHKKTKMAQTDLGNCKVH